MTLPVSTISLSDASARLALGASPGSAVAYGKLLALLRSGQINAGVQFTVGEQSHWLSIPASYWVRISNDKFKIIRPVKDKPKTGAFKVTLGTFAEQVAAQFQHYPLDKGALAHVLAACAKWFEVSIAQSEWDEFEKNNVKLVKSELPNDLERRGRLQKEGWRSAGVILGAYIIKHYQDSQEKIKEKEAGEVVHKLGMDAAIPGCPSARSLADELAKMYRMAQTISIIG